MTRGGFTEERVDRLIAGILRAGVLASTALVLVGAAVHLARHGLEHPDFGLFAALPRAGVAAAVRTAARTLGDGLVEAGLLVLLATPMVRVAFSAFAFLARGDRTYALITLTVLAALCFGLLGFRP